MVKTASIFSITTAEEFSTISLEIFRHQFRHNPVYHQFCKLLNKTPQTVNSPEEIPFLPIEFFKSHKILSSESPVETVFTSSGTTGNKTSKHFITNLRLYEESFRRNFEMSYGNIEDLIVLALLPSYLEREGSSLIYMVEDFIKKSNHESSGFYLNDLSSLRDKLITLDKLGKKILLIGVSFALLDLVEKATFNLKNTIVMETGGMKGRRKELVREELHQILTAGFGVEKIHSEYGMTELLSQGYSKGNGVFEYPPWMKVFIRDPEDALQLLPQGKTGGLNIIDLANVNSCSFIATQDLGKINAAGKLEIVGRFDNSDIRGCNLMVL